MIPAPSLRVILGATRKAYAPGDHIVFPDPGSSAGWVFECEEHLALGVPIEVNPATGKMRVLRG